MQRHFLGSVFVVESAAALAFATFAVLTIVWRDWVEIVFRIDPDHHSGALEWLIVGITFALAVGLAFGARHEWRMVVTRSTEAATGGADAR